MICMPTMVKVSYSIYILYFSGNQLAVRSDRFSDGDRREGFAIEGDQGGNKGSDPHQDGRGAFATIQRLCVEVGGHVAQRILRKNSNVTPHVPRYISPFGHGSVLDRLVVSEASRLVGVPEDMSAKFLDLMVTSGLANYQLTLAAKAVLEEKLKDR